MEFHEAGFTKTRDNVALFCPYPHAFSLQLRARSVSPVCGAAVCVHQPRQEPRPICHCPTSSFLQGGQMSDYVVMKSGKRVGGKKPRQQKSGHSRAGEDDALF